MSIGRISALRAAADDCHHRAVVVSTHTEDERRLNTPPPGLSKEYGLVEWKKSMLLLAGRKRDRFRTDHKPH